MTTRTDGAPRPRVLSEGGRRRGRGHGARRLGRVIDVAANRIVRVHVRINEQATLTGGGAVVVVHLSLIVTVEEGEVVLPLLKDRGLVGGMMVAAAAAHGAGDALLGGLFYCPWRYVGMFQLIAIRCDNSTFLQGGQVTQTTQKLPKGLPPAAAAD